MENSFVHHVFFWLKNPGSQADRDQLVAGLKTLTTIPGFISYHIGAPADTNREVIDRSYAVSWLCIFASGADEAIYQQHPTHLKFVDDNKHLWERVVVYDSEPV